MYREMQGNLRWFGSEEEERLLESSRLASPYRRKRSVENILDTSTSSYESNISDESIMASDGKENDLTLKDVLQAIEKIGRDVANVGRTVDELKGQIHLLHLEKDSMKKEIEELRAENEYLHNKVGEIESKVNIALEQSHQNAQYSRRNNLRFFGIKEQKEENVTALITDVVVNKLKIKDFRPEEIDIAHRVGPYDNSTKDPKPRGIIVRFVRRTMRNRIVKCRKMLAGSRMAITDDLTKKNIQLLAAVKKHPIVEDAWAQDGRIMVCIKSSGKIAAVSSVSEVDRNAVAWQNWKKKQQVRQIEQPGNEEAAVTNLQGQTTTSIQQKKSTEETMETQENQQGQEGQS